MRILVVDDQPNIVDMLATVLRRTGTTDRPDRVLRLADLELDPDTLAVRRAGEPIQLSPTELKLLRYFLQNPGRVLSRSEILRAVWEYDLEAGSNVVDTYVGYLRRKLDRLGPPLLVTHRGFGYALRAGRP